MKVIITGAAGYIGKQITEELAGAHELCLVDRRPVPGSRSIVAQLARPGVIAGGMHRLGLWSPRWERAFAGADVALHLAASVRPSASWKSLLRRCVEEPFEGFHVVYGVSAQPEAPYDLSHTCSLLSWKPQHLPRQTLR